MAAPHPGPWSEQLGHWSHRISIAARQIKRLPDLSTWTLVTKQLRGFQVLLPSTGLTKVQVVRGGPVAATKERSQRGWHGGGSLSSTPCRTARAPGCYCPP